MAQTPTHPPAELSDAPPNAPVKCKKPISAHTAWADFVDTMEKMPIEEAQRLTADDVNMHVGPIMDEQQFEEYRKTRRNKVKIIRG